MSDVTEGVVELWNRNHYTNASRYAIRWELKEDDKVIQSGDLALSTAPLSQELVHIPYKKPALIPGKEYRLMLHAVLKKDLSHVLLREGEQVTVEYRIAQKLSAPVKKGSCAGPSIINWAAWYCGNIRWRPQKIWRNWILSGA